MDFKHLVVFVTAPSHESAEQIAAPLLEKRLAACVNIVPGVRSHYLWQGKIAHDDEVLLVIKTHQARFSALEAEIKAVHPYEVPEIIALPIVAGSADYLAWIDDSVGVPHSK